MGEIFVSLMLFAGSILVCSLVYYICLNFFPLLTRNLDLYNQMRNNNLAVAVFTGGFVISVTVIIYVSSVQIFELFLNVRSGILFFTLLEGLLRAFIMFTMSMFISFLINWLAMKSFLLASNGIDDMKALKNNNLAVSFLITSMIIALTYMVMESVSTLNSAFVFEQRTGEYGVQFAFINLTAFLEGAIELFIMIITAEILFLIGLKITSFVTSGVEEFADFRADNIAISLIVCSSILSVMIMVKYCIHDFVTGIITALSSSLEGSEIFISVIRFFYALVTSTAISVLILWLSMGIFLFLSRMFDGMNEIKKRNVATAVILSVFTFSASFIMRSGVREILNVITFF